MIDRRCAALGAALGVAAWLLGFAGAWAAASVLLRGDALLGGFALYSLHFVPLVPADGAASAAAATPAGGNALLAWTAGAALPLAALPAVILALAGGVAAQWRGRRTTAGEPSPRRRAALSGASVALGYAPTMLVGAALFVGPLFGGVYRPDPALATVAGVAYPVAFGAVGGLFASALEPAAPLRRVRERLRRS